ncbi:hypothetical protein [Zavarzinia sp.]|uniref:hypothetical protein n=1 Tax=Zavarzinia sp. TaxID=2027920 RepID=UPI003567A1CA
MDREKREQLIEALNGLSAEDEAAVLANARNAVSLLAESGLDWADVIIQVARPEGTFSADFDHGAIDIDSDDDDSPTPLRLGDADVGRVLHALRARDDLSPETRAELDDFAGELAAGRLDSGDRAYVLALAGRLGVGRP